MAFGTCMVSCSHHRCVALEVSSPLKEMPYPLTSVLWARSFLMVNMIYLQNTLIHWMANCYKMALLCSFTVSLQGVILGFWVTPSYFNIVLRRSLSKNSGELCFLMDSHAWGKMICKWQQSLNMSGKQRAVYQASHATLQAASSWSGFTLKNGRCNFFERIISKRIAFNLISALKLVAVLSSIWVVPKRALS